MAKDRESESQRASGSLAARPGGSGRPYHTLRPCSVAERQHARRTGSMPTLKSAEEGPISLAWTGSMLGEG